jgi:hypothetical protein
MKTQTRSGLVGVPPSGGPWLATRPAKAGTPTRLAIGLTLALVLGLVFWAGFAEAQLVTTGLSIHYRADNVDGIGNPGNGSTVTLVNLATPGTHNGTIVAGSGVVQNVPQIGTPYEYGITLTSANQTHIQANTFITQAIKQFAHGYKLHAAA